MTYIIAPESALREAATEAEAIEAAKALAGNTGVPVVIAKKSGRIVPLEATISMGATAKVE